MSRCDCFDEYMDEFNQECPACEGSGHSLAMMQEAEPPAAMLRVILAAGQVWGFRRFAEVVSRVADIKNRDTP